MKYCILKKQEATPADFVEFWAKCYDDKEEPTYREYIGKSLTPESVRELFAWKAMSINRASIKAADNQFVETIIKNRDRFLNIQLNTPEDADDFLTNEPDLKDKGMIWKIFTLQFCTMTSTQSSISTFTERWFT